MGKKKKENLVRILKIWENVFHHRKAFPVVKKHFSSDKGALRWLKAWYRRATRGVKNRFSKQGFSLEECFLKPWNPDWDLQVFMESGVEARFYGFSIEREEVLP